MNFINTFLIHDLRREFKFALRDRTILLWVAIIFSLSSISVGYGLAEVKSQHESIQRLIDADHQDRSATASKLNDWGSAAYYSFHLTYAPPSDFAFAAIGQRDAQPWKHRVRMLALEGQIYERDTENPVIALIGRFDFAFLAAFILPLALIMLLYDVRASERTAGRYELLEATAGRNGALWISRVCIRVVMILCSLIIPLIIAAVIAGTATKTLLLACIFVFLYLIFWALICYWVATWRKPSSLILMTLTGIWLSIAVVIPAGLRLAIDRAVPVPTGAEILMLQREAVNDAWDLPREETMEAFFARHPEWSDYQPIKSSFEWQWYYAFQQVGDQRTEPVSIAYREGRLQRDRIADWATFLAPPSLLERSLQSLANTDVEASIAYEQQVRAYHARLRAFYYPKFFNNMPFDKSALDDLPNFN